jgi:clan AA aspartic protease (TIGR02281 family)
MRRKLAVATALSLLFAASTSSLAEIIEYVDENGTVNFTDDPAKVPKKYGKKKKTREGGGQANPVMSVRIVRNQVVVPVRLGYRGHETTANFLLDTGATTCTINPSIANRLHINPEDAEMGVAQVVGGGTFVVGSVSLDFVEAGPKRMGDVTVSVIQSPYDGLLGMNFLRNYRYNVDFDTHTIRWE